MLLVLGRAVQCSATGKEGAELSPVLYPVCVCVCAPLCFPFLASLSAYHSGSHVLFSLYLFSNNMDEL